MGPPHRQSVLASAAIAVAIMLGCARARAEYLSIAELAKQDGVVALKQPAATPLIEYETSSSMARPWHDTDYPPAPALPLPPLRRRPSAACNFGNNCSSNSSHHGPVGGPSSPLGATPPRPWVPPLQLTSLLPPQTDDTHPFSVASFLFRPPRAA